MSDRYVERMYIKGRNWQVRIVLQMLGGQVRRASEKGQVRVIRMWGLMAVMCMCGPVGSIMHTVIADMSSSS